MNEEWWEGPVCKVCDYGWLLLLFLILLLMAYFTRDYWLPIDSREPEPVLGTGDVQATLRWDGENDLDLHVIDPDGERIFFDHPGSASGGELDVDSNAGCGENMTNNPVENIFWPDSEAPLGQYRVSVYYFQQCVSDLETAFTVRLLVDGEVQEYEGVATAVDQEIILSEFSR